MEVEIKQNENAWLCKPMQIVTSNQMGHKSEAIELIFTPFESGDYVIINSGKYKFPVPFWVLKKMQYFYENLILCSRYCSDVPKVKDNILQNVLESKMITLLKSLQIKEILKLYNSAHFLKVTVLRRNIAAWFASKIYVADQTKVQQDLLRLGLGCKQIHHKLSENESLKALLDERRRQNQN